MGKTLRALAAHCPGLKQLHIETVDHFIQCPIEVAKFTALLTSYFHITHLTLNVSDPVPDEAATAIAARCPQL